MPLSDAARDLALRCETRVNELAREMSGDVFDHIPGYAELPDDMKDVEIAATARHGLRLFMRRVRGGGGRRGDHALFRQRAAQRAEEGLPLHLLLRTHALGTYALWRTLRDEARPGEEAALAELADFLLRGQDSVIGAVAETYLDERAALDAERREERRTLARALIDGAPAADRDALAELGLDGPVTVLALRLPPADGPAPAPIAVRRGLRRLQTALEREFGTDVLLSLDAAGGHALVPGAPEPADGLARRLARAYGGPVRCAAAQSESPGAIPHAARTASEVIRIAHASGRPPELHRLADVLLEYHLSRRDESSPMIAALLDPLDGRPELTDTLRTHLETRQDRRATARALGLHPNTVDNRLARIAELTGIDLASPRGTTLALCALLLRDSAPEPPSQTALPGRSPSGADHPMSRP
ncbi:PucR family transcriptional regulator [Streptomyces purpurogeneiscleroticus]|uniref:PucR family transcriptional regulator n=1 Tax=Streptomyces purpurogeneiscleroticus TaxID=68259 RepID=UPI001CC0DF94|nr:helix-turn-helix domain-containing protein [Streptomyces purpurogeneiscleroticus]